MRISCVCGDESGKVSRLSLHPQNVIFISFELQAPFSEMHLNFQKVYCMNQK